MDKPTQLYRHYDAQGRLLYVGISLSALVRLSGHRGTSAWFDDVARVDIEMHPSRAAALKAEAAAIRDEGPMHNRMLNRPQYPKGEPASQGARKAEERKKKRASGLVRMEEWIPADRVEEFRQICANVTMEAQRHAAP
jgi:hypothetical protein